MENLPDVLGPYKDGLSRIHENILRSLKEKDIFGLETVMDLLQCTFAEYVAMGHDDTYEWVELVFAGDLNRKYAVGLNSSFVRNKEISEEIVSPL